MENFNYDVVIIGGGPAGCTCALYTARYGLKTVLLDKNPAAGALAITHKIANYPGIHGVVSGHELLGWMRNQAIEFGADYKQVQVYSLDTGLPKKVYTPEGTFSAQALVLASGAMGRTASIPGETEYLGRGVSYCATCDGAFMRNRDVAVVGTSEEAIDEARVLTQFASTVHWIASKDITKLNGRCGELLDCSSVKLWNRARLAAIQGDESGVTAVEVIQRGQSSPQILPVEGVFIYLQGAKPIVDFLDNPSYSVDERQNLLGLRQIELTPNGGVKVDEMMRTNIPGIWAIGDVRNTPYKQAVVAAADGCIAAMSIDQFLNRRKSVKPDWS